MSAAPQSSRYELRLATQADDPGLRALLREVPLRSDVEVTFEREPDFFAATQGAFHQTLCAREKEHGRIVAIGSRTVRRGWLDGEECEIGYLSDLRIAPEHRSGTLLARGYRRMREWLNDGRAAATFTVIFAQNQEALRLLTAARAGLPEYRDRGLLHCPSLLARSYIPKRGDPMVERGTAEMLPDIVECLNRHHRQRQFAPVHSVLDFARWQNFSAEDFLLVKENGRIRGVIGVWDQRAFKQTRVIAYHGRMRWMAPAARLLKALPGMPRLPVPGALLPLVSACAIMAGDEPVVFRALLKAALTEAARRGAWYLSAGLHEREPLAPVLDEFARVPFFGRIFEIAPDKAQEALQSRRERIPHVEVSLL